MLYAIALSGNLYKLWSPAMVKTLKYVLSEWNDLAVIFSSFFSFRYVL